MKVHIFCILVHSAAQKQAIITFTTWKQTSPKLIYIPYNIIDLSILIAYVFHNALYFGFCDGTRSIHMLKQIQKKIKNKNCNKHDPRTGFEKNDLCIDLKISTNRFVIRLQILLPSDIRKLQTSVNPKTGSDGIQSLQIVCIWFLSRFLSLYALNAHFCDFHSNSSQKQSIVNICKHVRVWKFMSDIYYIYFV